MRRICQLRYLLLGAVGAALWVSSCALSVTPTSSEDRILTLELAAFPDRLSVEDSTATAEIWATLRRGDSPIGDSTVVFFAVTVGSITSTSYTKDGLAVAVLTSPGDGRPRRAEVVAQALTVRDTLAVDFVLFEE
jgi:hypothetical protein